MLTKRHLQEEIGDLGTLRLLTGAYSEIAALRMKRIRDTVLQTRDFMSTVKGVFEQVKASYRREVLALTSKAKGKGGGVTFIKRNDKTAAVLLSANTGLYGEIVRKTFEMFLRDVREKEGDIVIVGKLGRSLFLEEEKDRPHTYFDLPDYEVVPQDMSEVVSHLVKYREVRIYSGRYQNVVLQFPSVFGLSSESPMAQASEGVKYLFEPSLEEVLAFFETQIFASLFDQTVHESQLAKFASRMLALDQASENIKETLRKVELRARRLIHQVEGRKQLNTFSGMSLWRSSG